MSDDRWSRLEAIYHAALDQPPAERQTFVASACASDSALRREIESLLQHAAAGDELLETPAWRPSTSRGLIPEILSAGTILGRYQILGSAGAGGMGEVYRARDTQLDRTVAIKVLRGSVPSDNSNKVRIVREARAISALNHPHICTLYDVDVSHEHDFLVMEYLEGETLQKHLTTTGKCSLHHAIEYAVQIADVLSHAHRRGIVHRDLKPANVMLTAVGVKLLDFGLSKRLHSELPASRDTGNPTSLSQAEGIAGTLEYMSPEQVEGKTVDSSADVFAFGAVLYEMITGAKAFHDVTPARVVSRIVSYDPPPLSELDSTIPPALSELVQTCLRKSPDERFESMHDVALQLRRFAKPEAPKHESSAGNIKRVVWAAVAFGLLAVAVSVFENRRIQQEEVPVARFDIAVPIPDANISEPSAISPDGRILAFSTWSPTRGSRIWLRWLNSVETHEVADTEGAFNVFWSPDSRRIAFFTLGTLYTIDISNGVRSAICSVPNGAGGSWSKDGTILFADSLAGGRLFTVPSTGGRPTPIFEDQNEAILWPRFLPDGRHFVFTSLQLGGRGNGRILLGSLDTKDTRSLAETDSQAALGYPDHILFVRRDTLFAQRFDSDRLQLSGEPFPVIRRVLQTNVVVNGGARVSAYSVSNTGVLVFESAVRPPSKQLTWYDRKGTLISTVGETGPFGQIALSPDGKRVVMESLDVNRNTWDLWLMQLDTGVLSRVTASPADENDPVWSPDSRSIVYGVDAGGKHDLFLKAIGSPDERLLYADNERKVPECWLADGTIVYANLQGRTFYQLRAEGDRKPVGVLSTQFSKDEPHVSPDGRWVAYGSNESGTWEVYVASFPTFHDKRQISASGAGQPLWRRDSRELYYLDSSGALMAVGVRSGPTLEMSAPKRLFKTHLQMAPLIDMYQVNSDGERFLMADPVGESVPVLSVVTNWHSL